MRRRLLGTVAALAISSVACGRGDSSGAGKANFAVTAGMSIWDALDLAERSQFPDITFKARGKNCAHPGIEAGRDAGPRYLRIFNVAKDPKYPLSGNPYLEEGFATREEFIAAVRSHASLFGACQTVVLYFGRYQGWPSVDSFEVTVDTNGIVKSVTLLKEEHD